MDKITIKCYKHSRDIRKLILHLIKSGIATNVLKYNYIKEYTIETTAQDKKIQGIKTLQPKVIHITFDPKNKDKIYGALTKDLDQDRQESYYIIFYYP